MQNEARIKQAPVERIVNRKFLGNSGLFFDAVLISQLAH
jgi:hypothetical protein